MSVNVIIPARLDSQRLPYKLLRNDTGSTLLGHTIEAAKRAVGLSGRVICAVDCQELADVSELHGAMTMRTGPCASGTERCQVAAEMASLNEHDLVINWQADEPELTKPEIDKLIWTYQSIPGCDMATLAAMANVDHQNNPDVVKVRRGVNGQAIEFSRDPLPCGFRHVGIYAYAVRFLRWFAKKNPTRNEQELRLEQYRALDAGCRIHVALCDSDHPGIDTEEDYASFVERSLNQCKNRFEFS